MTTHQPIPIALRVALLVTALVAAACGSSATDVAEAPAPSAATSDSSAAPDTGGENADTGGADETATADSLAADTTADRATGGVLRIGLEAESDTLNPTASAFAPSGRIMGQAVFSTLVSYDEDDNWVPNLSESWTPSEDLLSWDVRLRPDVLFTDGTPLDADAVIATWEAQLANQLLSLAMRPILDQEQPIEKIDDLTVRLHASAPDANMPTYFAGQLGMIASPAWLEAAAANGELQQLPVGAGPYMVESRQQDQLTTLVANPDWIHPDGVFAPLIEFYPLPAEGARLAQLMAGDLDVIHATGTDAILQLREEDGLTRVEDDNGQETMLALNNALAPFDDARVREAATLAFPEADYDEFIRRGASTRADSLWPASSKWHDPSVKQVTDDPGAARVLIDSYCGDLPENCTDGKVDVTFTVGGPNVVNENITSVLQSGYEPIFNLSSKAVPQDGLVQSVVTGGYDMALWRTHGSPEPATEVVYFLCDSIAFLSLNFSRTCDPARDELLVEQRGTTDEAERIALWGQIQANLRDSFHYVYLAHTNWVVAQAEGVEGLCSATTPDGVRLKCVLDGTFWPQAISVE